MNRYLLLAAAILLLDLSAADAQISLPWRPRVQSEGSTEVAVFDMEIVTGEGAGRQRSLYAVFRTKDFREPGGLVFVRDIDEDVAQFLRRVDQIAISNAKYGLKTAAVYLTDAGQVEAAREKLRRCAERFEIRMPMALFLNKSGPNGYDLSEDHQLTVVSWKDGSIYFKQAITAADWNAKTASIMANDVLRLLDSSSQMRQMQPR